MAGGEHVRHVYATLLLSDSYLPGALVLAHSLRDAQTKVRLAVLVTLDTVSADSISQLNDVYDYVLPVPRIRNASPGNLYLMNRGDLHSAFTKINLWRLVQFSKIVYIDADVVAYRAPDELFKIPHDFAAAPDIGWPDLFNSGVMVLKPNMGDYYAMMAMAERGISFDGADQGLLNMHFKNSYHRLSFTYNVTPSAHYQYVPAYRHFQSSINMVHFIGANKPWFEGRHARHGSSPFEEMVGRWWAVYDRHYRAKEAPVPQMTGQRDFADFTHAIGQKAQQETIIHHEPRQHSAHDHGDKPLDSGPGGSAVQRSSIPDTQHSHHDSVLGHQHHHEDNSQAQQSHSSHHHHQEHQVHHEQHHHHEQHDGGYSGPSQPPQDLPRHGPEVHGSEDQSSQLHNEAPAQEEQKPESQAPVQMSSWDAQWQPPPSDSKPEAMNFPSTHYSMSQDHAPYVPPQRYPSPPKDMWYEVPKEPPAPPTQAPKPVFPWEGHQPRPSRTFAVETYAPIEPEPAETQSGEHETVHAPQADAEKLVADSPDAQPVRDPETPTTPTVKVIPPPPSDWNSFQHSNAWDEIPEIGRYVEGLQGHRRGRSQGSVGVVGSPVVRAPGGRRSQKPHGFKLTDFPSKDERPSLPVTPAPIARPSFWAQGQDGAEDTDASSPALPSAQGVPAQPDWDPEEQLQKLAKLQHEALLRKLGSQASDNDAPGRIIPKRSLPFGSEDVKSPTYVQQVPLVAPKPAASFESEVTGSTISGSLASRRASGPGTRQSSLIESPLPDTEA